MRTTRMLTIRREVYARRDQIVIENLFFLAANNPVFMLALAYITVLCFGGLATSLSG